VARGGRERDKGDRDDGINGRSFLRKKWL